MKSVAIALDGVLRKPLDVEAQDFGSAMLYGALVDSFRVVILGTQDPIKDEHFLTVNGFSRYVKIEPEQIFDAPTTAGRKRAQLNRLRAEGYRFEFVVIPDPTLAIELYRTGTPVLMYLHPLYSVESYRPDYTGGIKPWADLVNNVEYSRNQRAEEIKKREEQDA